MFELTLEAISNYPCWICNKPSDWHFMACNDQGRCVEFFSCKRCIPFILEDLNSATKSTEKASISQVPNRGAEVAPGPDTSHATAFSGAARQRHRMERNSMKGGVTYLDMEKRKDAEFALKRLEMWLHKEAIVHDFISDAAINTIRNVLAGCLPPRASIAPSDDDLAQRPTDSQDNSDGV